MKQVVEDPSGVNYATNYTYSTTGNLIKVEQGTQYRYFLYDSLSRLLRARNPEQTTNSNLALTPPSDQSTGNTAWALKYVYDANGNLTSKAEARNNSSSVPMTTSYGYDALNRNIWTSYNDSLTPTLERHYDAASNGKGRLYYTVNYNLHPLTSAAAYSYTQVNGYDAMGRVTGQTQNFLNTGGTWTGYTTSRTYDLAGHPLVQTYPSNRTVTKAYGDSGRLTSNTGTLGNGTSRNYATGITYTAAGLMSRETFGMQASTLYHNLHYNNRQQLVDIRVGDSSTDEWNWTRGALVYYYGTASRDAWDPFKNSPDNNGNVLRQINYLPLSGGGNVVPQLDDYNCDALNRNVAVSYSDGTPTIERYYDKHPNASQNGKGRLYYNVVYRYEGGNPAFLRTIMDQYDELGRPETQIQSFYSHLGGVWQDYTSTMSHDLAGSPTGESYPSSRSVATTYSLSGRISGLSTNSTTLLSDMSYEAFGGLASEKYAAGNNLIHAMSYNNRLQPSEIKLGTSGTSDSIFKLNYIYGTASSPTDADGFHPDRQEQRQRRAHLRLNRNFSFRVLASAYLRSLTSCAQRQPLAALPVNGRIENMLFS